MSIIKQFFGVIYILCILIIAIDIMYYLFIGILPANIKELSSGIFNNIDNIANILCFPVRYLIDIAILFLPPFFKNILPVTDTGVFGAKIAWVPTFALFLYTGILRYIDEYLRSIKIDRLKKEENDLIFIKHSELQEKNIFNNDENNIENKTQGE